MHRASRHSRPQSQKPSRNSLLVAGGLAALLAGVVGILMSIASLGAQGTGCTLPSGNPIVCENALAGNPASEWDVNGAGDDTIQGFATDISVNRGLAVTFKIKSTAASYRLDIYRMGYYNGSGARKVATVTPSATLPQVQPACLTTPATGLVDCGNWAVSATWTVPATATSGIYFAKAVRPDTGGASHVVFIVRDDASQADLLFQTSDTTWQAYNEYGGNSLYVGAPGTNPARAYKVSYNRPFTTRGTGPQDWVFNAEYPMVRFLESNGYNIAYAAGVDTDRLGAAAIQRHRVFLSVGHDEYWSGAQRANVETARSAGVNLAFFSGNEVFWKTRWENSISSGAASYRTLVSYKETHANAKIDPTAAWTGTWRDPRFSPPADGGRPENALTGTIFAVNTGTAAIQVPAAEGKMRFWRGTTVASQAPGATETLTAGTLGYEWDQDSDNGFRPAGLVRLSDTTVSGVETLQDYGSTYAAGSANHALTLYRHASGARVFGAGTVQWTWGLDSNHDRGAATASVPMRQATVNLMADMGVQPLTIQSGLVTTAASTDTLAPSSTITIPAAGGTVPANSTVTVTGTAVDNGFGQVAAVEVSVDGGATWNRATGRDSWSYSWNTGAGRTVTLRSRASDDSGNIEVPAAGRTVIVGTGTASCPCSIWANTQTPAQVTEQDSSAVEIGTKFRTDINGYITAIRFYKGPQNVGPHIGHLWTATGTSLGSVTFTGETASGWQQAPLGAPVAVTANTTYVVSYHTDSGYYSGDDNYFATKGVDNGPLHALRDGVDGPNGLYRYGGSAFPTETYESESYWADVVFTTTVVADTTPPTISSVTPANGASAQSVNTAVTANFSEPMNAATFSSATFELRTAASVLVPAVVSVASTAATLRPNAPLNPSSVYTAKVRGGASGVKDSAGNALGVDYTWSFTTGAPPPPPPTTGPGGPILVVTAAATNPFSQYYAEVLRAEGLNAFAVADVSTVTATTLASYDVVILGNVTLTAAQVTTFTNWVTSGGNLIAMRPDKKLASLLGLTDTGATLSEGYLLVNTSAAPGTGIVGQTMQFHGVADRYTATAATTIATLYSTATATTANPAVTVRSVGSQGGQAAAFTYDLARSIVFTRQGNPAWAGQDRDGLAPIRSDDLFFGGAQADYADRSKVAIPQADEQQRLLANLIGFVNLDRKPLPRFWYFPRGGKAVIVMTGDDHGNNGTQGRFDIFNSKSPQGCNVADWECIRGTSYIYPRTPISPAVASAFVAQGFEIGVHVTTNCDDYTPASLESDYNSNIEEFTASFPALPAPATNRTHCIVWSDYDTQPQVALAHGIRLDTNYYYWPDTWVNNVPGLFTGSGMPMRFAKADGTMIDVYQAATQMTDESGQSFPFNPDTLLDRALGAEGYYGAFVVNAHTDQNDEVQSSATVSSAQLRGVPVVSAQQMLEWLDGRNGSSFGSISWNGTNLSFTVVAAAGSNGLRSMLPASFGGRALTALTRNGVAVPFSNETIKGVAYATFNSAAGNYVVSYASDAVAPLITGVSATPGFNSAAITWSTDEPSNTRVDYGTTATSLTSTATVAGSTTTHSVSLTALSPTTTYFYRVTSADLSGNSTTSPAAATAAASFTTTASPYTCPCTIWPPTQVPANASINDASALELGLKWRALTSGFVTGVRFYKGAGNTGVHTGRLWSSGGAPLATVTFGAETASGWQEALFDLPVAVTANTTYVVSYHTNTGFYAADAAFFQSSGVTNGPLQALATGVDGLNGVYHYGASGFPSDSFNATNYWVDVTFATSVVTDTTAPTVTVVSPVNDGANISVVTPITAKFSENVNVATVTTATFQLRDPQNVVVAATVTYNSGTTTATLQPAAALASSTLYSARVVGGSSGVKDPSGNAMLADFTWSFTTQAIGVVDTTTTDFAAGTLGTGVYVAASGNGEVILTPSVAAEFSDTALPAGWSVTPWAEGGTAVVANGALSVDGALASVDATVPAGVSLEFAATFSGERSEHAGFGLTFNETLWAMFSTGTGNALYARTHDGTTPIDTPIPGDWLGSRHIYRIDWASSSVAFFIDGVEVANRPTVIATAMRPVFSNFDVGGQTLKVDRVTMNPYATSGTFTSRVLSAGGTLNWTRADWTAIVPATTTLTFSARYGNTPTPDATWTNFIEIPSSGSAIAQTAQFVQYQAVLAGTGVATPVLQDVSFSGVLPTPPTLSVADISVVEGNSGSTNAVFTITSSYPSINQVRVAYATANGTATSGSDYTATSGTATIAANTTSVTVNVPIAGDTLVEANETFTLNLSAPVNATIADAQSLATITNDDQFTLSINSVAVTEGNTTSVTAGFTVTLSQASTQTVTVNYATADGTATAGADYTLTTGVVTFAPGIVTRPVSVVTLGDTRDEDNETFSVVLSNPVGAIIALGTGTGTITDNDATPTLAINNVTVTEGNTGSLNAVFAVTLSAASNKTVTVNYATANGTAVTPADYTAASGVLTFAPGTVSQPVTVAVIGDVLDEPNETFAVNLTAATNATISDAQGTGTITDNDAATATISIADASVTEGNTGSKLMPFVVTLSAASGQAISVNFQTNAGTASSAGGDYTATSGTLTIPAGSTTGTINVSITGNTVVEPNETFTVTLSGAVNAAGISDATGIGTILNDD